MEQILLNMLESGTPSAVLAVVVYFLFRQLQAGNQSRIGDLELRSTRCEEDRKILRARLDEEIAARREAELKLWERVTALSSETGRVAIKAKS